MSGTSKTANKDLKNNNTEENKKELARWYPDSTLNQINARDCTNYEPGHPLSCVQALTKENLDIKTKSSLIKDDLLLETENDKKKEAFCSSGMNKSTQAILEKVPTLPTLFKNAPGYVENNTTRDISSDLCRGCTVGQCSKGVCGSRLLETGNENILDVDGYVTSYVEDNMDPRKIKESKPINPWTFF